MDHEINGAAVLLGLPGLLLIGGLVAVVVVGLPLLIIERTIRLFVPQFRLGPFKHCLYHMNGDKPWHYNRNTN